MSRVFAHVHHRCDGQGIAVDCTHRIGDDGSEYFDLGISDSAVHFVNREQLRQIRDTISETLAALETEDGTRTPEEQAFRLAAKHFNENPGGINFLELIKFAVEYRDARLRVIRDEIQSSPIGEPSTMKAEILSGRWQRGGGGVENVHSFGEHIYGDVTMICPNCGDFTYRNVRLPALGGRCPDCNAWVNNPAQREADAHS